MGSIADFMDESRVWFFNSLVLIVICDAAQEMLEVIQFFLIHLLSPQLTFLAGFISVRPNSDWLESILDALGICAVNAVLTDRLSRTFDADAWHPHRVVGEDSAAADACGST
jgi:hypothetical protein